MSNVYSVGNNRQLIIYNAGSNIFLRVAHFGGLDRPIVLAQTTYAVLQSVYIIHLFIIPTSIRMVHLS